MSIENAPRAPDGNRSPSLATQSTTPDVSEFDHLERKSDKQLVIHVSSDNDAKISCCDVVAPLDGPPSPQLAAIRA